MPTMALTGNVPAARGKTKWREVPHDQGRHRPTVTGGG
ncbi:hypothetical protein SEA_ACFISHHOOK_77 [Mycobacterium phage ACFishhook]|nr:hypothetical protein SEA_ACFISHHOOK_77 [Mycobacterium phage ACFishhook]